MITFRQIEVIRAVMVTGAISGAAKLLNVSAPGVSRLVKHADKALGVRFFHRKNGRFFPTPEAERAFAQINAVYRKVDDLNFILSRIGRGDLSELRIGSVPSIAQSMTPRAIERVRRPYPDLRIDVNILKIEEAIEYLLLGKGECVAMSYRFDHPGIDPNDPYGRIMAEIFARHRLRLRYWDQGAFRRHRLRAGEGGPRHSRHRPVHCRLRRFPWRQAATHHGTDALRNLRRHETRRVAVVARRIFHPVPAQ